MAFAELLALLPLALAALVPGCLFVSAFTLSRQRADVLTVASVVTTAAAHGLTSGESVTIAGSNSSITIDGVRVVTVLSPTTFSVPVDTSGGANPGTAGTVTFGTVAGEMGKLIDATAGRLSLLVVASPINPSYVFVGATNTITASAYSTATYAATDGIPIPAGGSKPLDAGAQSPYYGVSLSAAHVYVETVTA